MGEDDPRGPGAPRKLTPEVRAELLKVLAEGQYRKHACLIVGVSTQTLANEMKRDAEFKRAVCAAEMKATRTAVKTITKASKKDWKAALAFLGRKHPEWVARPRELPKVGGRDIKDVLAEMMLKLGVTSDVPEALKVPQASPDPPDEVLG